MGINESSQEQFVSQNAEKQLDQSSYYYRQKAFQREDFRPFYIEMVNSTGKTVSIPYPPLNGSVQDGQVLAIRMMVNPTTLSVNMAKIISRTQTMIGYVEDHWGEEIDTITFQGSSAAFVYGASTLNDAGKANVLRNQNNSQISNLNELNSGYRNDLYTQLDAEPLSPVINLNSRPGLSVSNRRSSVAYQQLKNLVKMFSTNGCTFDSRGFVADRKSIRINYDYSSYTGYFESIDISEDAESPYKFTYTVTFKSEKTNYKFIRGPQGEN